jgi:hypothetical protein
MGSYWLDATTVLSDFVGYVYSIMTKPSLRYLGATGNLIGMITIHIRPMLRLQQLPSQEPTVPTTILTSMQDQGKPRLCP